MKLKSLILSVLVLSLVAGCAMFQPVAPDPVQAQAQTDAVKQQSQQLTNTISVATNLLAQLKAAQDAAKNQANPPAIPVTGPTAPTTAPAVPSVTAKASDTTAVINLLTTQLQALNTQMQNAPNVDAQRQAAFNAGVQTAQAAATTFGGPYGTLIAAGIGIVSVLVQGLFNSQKAHTTAQQAQATANAAVGAVIGGSGRFAPSPVDRPGNLSPKPLT